MVKKKNYFFFCFFHYKFEYKYVLIENNSYV